MWAIHRSTLLRNSVPCASRNITASGAIRCVHKWRRIKAVLNRTPTIIFAALLALIAPPCFAGIDIQITGVTETLEKNVRAFLSMTRYAGRDDLTSEIVGRLERRIPTEVRKALEPLGYYSASATHKLSQNGKQWSVQIAIDPGRAVRISESHVEIAGAGVTDPSLQAIVGRGDLHPGARLDHGVYEAVKAELLRTAINNGYLDAKLTQNEMIVDPAERRATVYLSLDTGERYRFGAIDVRQPVLNDAMARRILRMKSGDPYTLNAVLESQYLFDDSQYFTAVEFEPGEPNHDTHEVPLAVRAEKNKRNRYAIAGGYGTDTNVRGKLTWDDRYRNSRGHRSQIELTGSGVLQQATAKYVIPVMDVALEKFEVNVGVKKEQLGDLTSRRGELGFGLTEVFSTWQRVLFLQLSQETSEPTSGNADPSSVPQGKTFLLIPGISFGTLPPNLLQATNRRYSLYAELTGSPKTLGSDATFLQLRTNGERVFDLAPRWRTRVRGQLGLTWSEDFDSIPITHRFFAGGDNSVRGFGLNELSPLDPATGAHVGGRYLAVGSVELERDIANRWLPENLSGAVFVDAGNALNSFSDPLEYSVGVGLRYRLVGVASIGFDVAQALSENRSPRLHLRLATLF
jgi:translocation and assembly module TamA